MNALILKDITLEFSTQDNNPLTGVLQLVLEAKLKDDVVSKVDLLSSEVSRGVWDAHKVLVVPEINEEFTLSIFNDSNENERQLLGFIKSTGRTLCDVPKVVLEIPSSYHEDYPSLVLTIGALRIENIQRSTPALNLDIIIKLFGDSNESFSHFQILEDMESLEQAVLLLQTAMKMAPEFGLQSTSFMCNLGVLLRNRFERLGNLPDINDAITQLQAAVDLTPDDDSDKPMYSSNLGASFLRRFERLGNMDDLDNAIVLGQKAVSLTPEGGPDKPKWLDNLGNFLDARFKRLGDPMDLDHAIESKQAAIELAPDDPINKPVWLSSLGISYTARFERFGNITDLNDAIRSIGTAANLMPDFHPRKPVYLGNLGVPLISRFRRFGDIRDLDDAIESFQSALNLALDDNPYRPTLLNNLGAALELRFNRLENIADLENAIQSNQNSVSLTLDDHPDKAARLASLGVSLGTRFGRAGDIVDLDNSIISYQAAINLTPDSHSDKPRHLNNLGSALHTRFRRFGNIMDLHSAIQSSQAGTNLTPDSHPDKPAWLNNLGVSLLSRSDRLGDTADLSNAILLSQEAVNLTPDGHPDKIKWLNNLGWLLRTRFERAGDSGDLETAIQSIQNGIDIKPHDHPEKHKLWSNLGMSQKIRFERFGSVVDLENAVASIQAALDITPDDSPHKVFHLAQLGYVFKTRFHHLHDRNDAQTAISHLSAASLTPFIFPYDRWQTITNWISLASLTGHETLLSAYKCALDILPLLAWQGLPLADRHRHLAEIGGVTRDAVAASIAAQQYETALEWLEHGRSIVWTQILQLRTPVDELRIIKPDLADRLIQVSLMLDRSLYPSEFSSGSMLSSEEEGRRYRALTVERESIIKQVRLLEDFENFLKSPCSSQLVKVAKDGPVVVLNIAKERCDALALVPGLEEIIHIPLPDITAKRVTELRDEMKDLLCTSGVRLRAAMRWTEEGEEADCRHILAELWNGIVKPVLDSLAFSPHPDNLPRIWWCVTGPLSFLPIHAAGIYDPGSDIDQLSNYAISSYIPTLSALLKPPSPAPSSSFKLLSVIQPSAPGVSSILSTREELKCIQCHILDDNLTILEDVEGTKTRVVAGMGECNWVHLACHGIQKPDAPTKSALILQDGHLTLEEIVKLQLPNAEFAFLSACQTTTGDERLSEEAVHIAGAMLLAGYRGVVATMWSIRDELAPEVADEFYAYLTQNGQQPDSRRAAEALHFSVQKLRNRPGVSLLDWLPFVHLGV